VGLEPRTVVLHKGRKGFGFILRGAKAMSPLMEMTPSEKCPALQYLDDVDPGKPNFQTLECKKITKLIQVEWPTWPD